ncbi:phage tail protein [Avibacterium paragallinarum]|uniref:phage tail protein n=1 Tax=Avibacterium paragallinarum TaxID=728 RepID=UPI00397827B7
MKLLDLFKTIVWAKNGDTTDFSQTNYEAGWAHLGDDTPTVQDFNYVQQMNDKKDQWLFNQIKSVCENKGIALSENDQQTLLKAINTSATLSRAGITQLSSALNSVAEDMAATPKAIKTVKDLIDALTRNLANYIPNSKKSSSVTSSSSDTVATSQAVKTAYDRAVEAEGKGLPVGAVLAFPSAVQNPHGFLRCDGSSFGRTTYPALYQALGVNTLPDLRRSDVGMTAYFPTDNIPAGWIAFDDIEEQVSEQAYPELYRHLVAKYGSLSAVPKAKDRFIRNAGALLAVGEVQQDALQDHFHYSYRSRGRLSSRERYHYRHS